MLLSAKHFTSQVMGRVEIHADAITANNIVVRSTSLGKGMPDFVLAVERQTLNVNFMDCPEPLELPTLDKMCCVDFSATARRRA